MSTAVNNTQYLYFFFTSWRLYPCRVLWDEGWTAAVSLRFVCRKSTHCTSFKKVTHTALRLCHLSPQPHISTQNKGEPGGRDGNRAPAFYCPLGLWMNIGPLMIRPAEVVALFPAHTHSRGQTAFRICLISNCKSVLFVLWNIIWSSSFPLFIWFSHLRCTH